MSIGLGETKFGGVLYVKSAPEIVGVYVVVGRITYQSHIIVGRNGKGVPPKALRDPKYRPSIPIKGHF